MVMMNQFKHNKVRCIDCANYGFVQREQNITYCPYTGYCIENPGQGLFCSEFVPLNHQKLYLSDKEICLIEILKTFRAREVTILSIPEKFRGCLGKLQSKGLVSLSTSWIKTDKGDFKRIKTVRILNLDGLI